MSNDSLARSATRRSEPPTVPFYKIEWDKEDWIDFWHTLEAFQDRVAERHGVRRKK